MQKDSRIAAVVVVILIMLGIVSRFVPAAPIPPALTETPAPEYLRWID